MMSTFSSPYVPQPGEKVLFITGRLAEDVTRRCVAEVSSTMGFSAKVHVVGVSVAALMHVDLLLRRLTNEPQEFDHVFVPGWCQGDIHRLAEKFGVPFSHGPKDILDLSRFFGHGGQEQPNFAKYDIEIIAEINHAPQLSENQLLAIARHYDECGADVIDVGGIPGQPWGGMGHCVHLLKQAGFRVSVDSFDRHEVEAAISAGAELVLSCNSSNVGWLQESGVEVVAIPDQPNDLESLWRTVEILEKKECRYRLDPILEPIGFGFAESLERYYRTRKRCPLAPMMMGVGNLTEMTGVDSSGVNVILAAICQELNINSVLTTEVITWCQSAVQEFDMARRIVKHAIDHRTLPKRLSDDLLMLRDAHVAGLGAEGLQNLARQIQDSNYRIFVEANEIHVINRNGYWRGQDAFELFDEFCQQDNSLDVSHAFYLGYELAKAVTALTLGKQYRQDESLNWGFLTTPETSVHERRKARETEENRRSADD